MTRFHSLVIGVVFVLFSALQSTMASLDITYAYGKIRSQFGRQCKFIDKPAQLVTSIKSDDVLSADYIPRNPVHRSSQCSVSQSLQEVSWHVLSRL